jgi:hypothetical protein
MYPQNLRIVLTIVWVDQKESFTCALDECSFKLGIAVRCDQTKIRCNAQF